MTGTTDKIYDLAIVGGGPAGQAAALQVAAAGLSVCVIDEQPLPGGQVLRQPAAAGAGAGWMKAAPYRRLAAQHAAFVAEKRIDWIGGFSVHTASRQAEHFRLSLVGATSRSISARRMLIAAGCYDIPVPLPGWTLPGVMSAGAVQTLLKAQGIVPGERCLLFGTHPLMLVLAEQIVAAGHRPAAVCFAQSQRQMLGRALPHALRAMRTPGPLLAGLGAMARLRRAGVPVHFDASVQRLVPSTDGNGLGAAEVAIAGRTCSIDADLAAMCFGFMPQSDLPRAMRAAVAPAHPAGWRTLNDAQMMTDVPGLYVAGETVGVTGADAAMAEGTIAGAAITHDLGALDAVSHARIASAAIRQRERLNGFADLLAAMANPREHWPEVEADTLLCRCEDVPCTEVDRAILQHVDTAASGGASAAKLRCRAGMGPCQGRGCEHSVMRRMAQARDLPVADIAGFRARFPIRPVPLGSLVDPD